MPVDKMPVKIAQVDKLPAGFGAGWTECRSLKNILINSVS